jgi:predicted RND superfamily exporter protein
VGAEQSQRRYAKWVAFIERRHRAILGCSLALALASALSLLALRFDFDVLGMLPTGAPAFDNFKTFVAEFGELDELVVLVEGEGGAGDRAPAVLQGFADDFAMRVRGLDTVQSVHWRLDIEDIERGILGQFLYNYVPEDDYARLGARLTPEGIDAQVAADRAMLLAPFDLSSARLLRRDPLGIVPLAAEAIAGVFDAATLNLGGGYLSTPDGRALLVMVRPTRNAFDIAFTTRLMEQVRGAEAAARRDTPGAAGLRVGYTGSYAFALEDAATLKRDVARYTVLALVGVLAVFYLGYRTLRILPFVTYPLVLSTLLTFAASLLCYAQLNAVSLSFAAILYGLSIDSGIHYYTRLMQEMRQHDVRAAVTRTLANLGSANVVASSTTAAAFCVIGFSDLAGVSQLGVLTAIGMMINIAEFFLVYPALSFWMPRGSFVATPLETPRLGRLAAVSAGRARGVALVAGLAGASLLLPASRVGFDVDLTHLRPGASAASRVQDEIAARFGAAAAAGAVLVRAPLLEQALQASETIASRLAVYRGEGLVENARGISALLPSERTQRERLALFNQLPRAQILQQVRDALERHGFVAAEFTAFFADFGRPRVAVVRLGDAALAPFEPVIARHVRQGAGGFTVATYVEPGAGVSLATVADRLRSDLPGIEFVVAGRSLLQEELRRLLRRELTEFSLAAFALNLLLILGNYPRLGAAVAILVPEALVIACCLALMRVTGLGIDPVNLIVVPLILGIGVDNCVYVTERHQRGEAIGDAVRHGGKALVICSLTTMVGFGFLGLSRYPALARMGLLAAASLFLCLVAALTVLPALLTLLAPGVRCRVSGVMGRETANHSGA